MPRTIGNPHGYPDYTWPMVWVLQDAELWPIEQWVAHIGVNKLWFIEDALAAGASNQWAVYTVPAGKSLYLAHCWMSQEQPVTTRFYYTAPNVTLFRGYVVMGIPLLLALAPPVVVPAGMTLWLYIYNRSSYAMTANATIQGYELPA